MSSENTISYLDRKVAPNIIDPVDLDLALPPCERYELRNGSPVCIVEGGPEEVLLIEWIFYAGNWYEEKSQIAASTNYLIKNGTAKRNAFQINEHFEYYGAYLNVACYNETAVVKLHCLNKHLPELLPIIREILTEPEFPEEEISIYKKNMQQRLAVNLQKPDFVANRLIDTYLYGEEHPYGKFSTPEGYDSLQRDDLISYFRKHYLNGRFLVFAAGRMPANFRQLLDEYFGDFTAYHTTGYPAQTVVRAEQKKYRIQNDANGIQGAIRLARPFPTRRHPDFQPALVLNNIFGGFFGSRLMDNIREDKGYTYGIYSYIQNHIHETAWLVSTEAGREVCEATLSEVYNEMEDLRNELVDEEELRLVKNYMMGTLLGDLDGPFQVLARWKNIILNDLPDSYFQNSIQTIKTVSAQDIQRLANEYLQPEAFYELVVI